MYNNEKLLKIQGGIKMNYEDLEERIGEEALQNWLNGNVSLLDKSDLIIIARFYERQCEVLE